ncbi:MAG: hypothetical protein KBC53_00170 [Nitrosomonas sp.]|nr:hypothetical protein [Nitrosomonas sp.]
MEFEPITFNLIEAKKRVVVGLGVIRIAELDRQIDGIWSLSWFNNKELLRADELRQIAAKLEELNGK